MKNIRLLSIACLFFSASFSQNFMHGAGISVFVTKVESSDIAAYGGFTYSPRINFLETESLSLSLGIPLSVATSGSYSYNSRTGYTSENDMRFLFNAPLIVNVNVGAGSTRETESRFGAFAGGGFGYNYGNFNVTETDEYGNTYEEEALFGTYGPAANAGFRIAVGSQQKNIETRFSYMKGITHSKPAIFGLAALFNF
ncbi:MAG TPA: hypothetical protein VKA49_13080 [Flavitalea sp.]|nr:hypothetical protein [Flavitalea sp.]